MNHVRILFSLRLGSEAMELFDEKRERERKAGGGERERERERKEREIRDDPSRRAPGDKRETLKVL